MAIERRRLAGWAGWLDDRERTERWWGAALTLSLGLLLTYWFVPVAGMDAAGLDAAGLGAAGLGTVRGMQALERAGWSSSPGSPRRPADVLNSELAQWLGDRSFSLYLVHLPVIVAVTTYLGGQPHLGGVLIASAAIAFPLAAAFHRFVEQPAHRLARSIGQRISNARSPEPRPRPIIADLIPAQRTPIGTWPTPKTG